MPEWMIDEYAMGLSMLDPTDETLEAYVALIAARVRAKVSLERAERRLWDVMQGRYL